MGETQFVTGSQESQVEAGPELSRKWPDWQVVHCEVPALVQVRADVQNATGEQTSQVSATPAVPT